MYFVDRKKIEQHLQYMEQLLQHFNGLSLSEDHVSRYALERIGHLLIECMMDAGNSIIDGFIMRDPGSFEDILDIMDDEKVIPSQEAASLKHVVALRKQLVQDYVAVEHQQVQEVIQINMDALQSFTKHVRAYLENELGPVSAFLPEN
ncbi:DUF86 domain-containing protein [Fictibacillus aquaticus]|uniref:DUF86 domain-containing protein n=1 Tax=Fictibacillus aquaticus TaxID=2021314 RepID=A0A235F544_9BACL|nr:DUF86 domain-containing protein [Fictibacillus aquaticus]OYD56047.1 hypothetical protein CGZ90_19590 [Fictibacillus aquaticus]